MTPHEREHIIEMYVAMRRRNRPKLTEIPKDEKK